MFGAHDGRERLRGCRRGALLLTMAAALLQPAQACFYGDGAFDPDDSSQTAVEGVLSGRYDMSQKEQRKFYEDQLQDLKQDLATRRGDPDFLDSYALALYRTGQEQQAQQIWGELLKKEPDRFVTLSNMGTAFHQRHQLEKAAPLIGKAAALRPDFRGGAERWHARMIDFVLKQRKDARHNSDHLFIEELTPLWLAHRPGARLPKLPVDVTSSGLAELLREFPKFGDGWVVLGVVLESEGKPHLALRVYERALKLGTGQRERLEPYVRQMRLETRADDPVTRAKRGAAWAGTCLLVLVIGALAYRLGGAVWEDLKESREKKRRGGGPPAR